MRRQPTASFLIGALLLVNSAVCPAFAGDVDEAVRREIGWGWKHRPHGQTLASDVLGQFTRGDPSQPDFGRYGPYGGPKPHGFFFYAFNSGRYQTLGGMAAHRGARKLAIDEERRRLWSGLFALDIAGDLSERVPVIGWFGLGPHERSASLQDDNTGPLPNLLGYSVGFCHRFGGGLNATAVNPKMGTVYVADSARYRVLCFQPSFRFHETQLTVANDRPFIGLSGSGGLAPLEFSIEAGTLPNGLKFDRQTGIVSGTASDDPGKYPLDVCVRTALGDVRGRVTLELRSE